jgi:hypothetical protein
MLSVGYADYHLQALNAKSCNAECHYAECRSATPPTSDFFSIPTFLLANFTKLLHL